MHEVKENNKKTDNEMNCVLATILIGIVSDFNLCMKKAKKLT
jgi:hypothetical protein